MSPVRFEDVVAARERVAGEVHRTPVLTSRAVDERAGRRVLFKCENFQRVGAFKFRGATNAVRSLAESDARRGVVTHSSGNHAQALALAAQRRGIPAWIVMPRHAPGVKRRAVEGYGATVVECEPTLRAREATASRVAEETGATFIHPYDDDRIIAGQGTCALEFLEQASAGEAWPRAERGERPDVIVAPVGGGGLMSGTCLAARGVSPEIRLFGAEPRGADDAARSLRAGRIIPQEDPQTIADGLRTGLGTRTFPILRDHLESIVTVGEEAIAEAMRFVWERMKIVIEPSAAVAVAAGWSRELEGAATVGVILSGGNVEWGGRGVEA